ncbi:Tripartite-type tricarboxylate transporter, receptor component TctC [Variovorax sp. HW608]|uniref:Bug family tripartite tricarboxylate transporter substrate binding protein n=1 Tax=Variovorax sp. HW608 TaxID=1034889 RepID=UPI00081FEA81|nr:tripartite tricarboxylate transporter substrate binding protein [Variovorax sp. HW608]SCK32216.1 Tripartite-type tricarboxylate transporter, receptor component TctC [Variovorax sp. HW608]
MTSRRLFLSAALAAGTLATLGMPSLARAEGYPDKPVKLVVPFPPGGITDVIARNLANHAQQAMGQPMIVDNRPGGGGVIATDLVAKAPADGHTVLLAAIGQAVVNKHLFKKLPYDPNADLAPVSLIAQGPNVLVVNASSPYKTVADLLAAAKKSPEMLTFGTYGNGSSPHLQAALLMQRTGARFTHIPYKGSAPAMNDLLGGQTTFMFDSLITSLQNIRAGKLRPLAVTSPKRSLLLPDVPTFAEAGVSDFSFMAWYGIHVPGKTPPKVIERLHREIDEFTHNPAVARQFADQGLELTSSSPADYARFLASEDKTWGAVIQQAGITID